jgi:hypothetical protein
MLRFSCANVVSSPGFLPHLPKSNYLISHNMGSGKWEKRGERASSSDKTSSNLPPLTPHSSPLKVLTIGAIRDLEANMEVVKALANHEGFTMQFVGKGHAAPIIEEYCHEHDIKNVSFTGFYEKKDEAHYVEQCTLMNIFYPRVITHDTALSNRFYLSLQHHRPMIVTRNTTQGDYAEHYQVGIAVDDCHDLTERIREFFSQDFTAYEQRCNNLLDSFMEDQKRFEAAVEKFVNS